MCIVLKVKIVLIVCFAAYLVAQIFFPELEGYLDSECVRRLLFMM